MEGRAVPVSDGRGRFRYLTDDDVHGLVGAYGMGRKLRRAVEARMDWRGDDRYREWPSFGAQLERVVRDRRANGLRCHR